MKKLILVGAVLAGATLLQPVSGQAQGTLIFDDFLFDNASMPRDNLPGFPTLPGFFEWTVTDGSVDLVGSSILNPPGDLFGRYVDLGGSTGDPGLFAYALPITLLPNVSYTLSFLFNSVDGPANTASIRFVDQTFTVSSSTAEFATFSRDFTFPSGFTFAGAALQPPSASPLTFQDLGADNSGLGVDRIMVTPTVPEPGSVILLAAGATCLCARRVGRISKHRQPTNRKKDEHPSFII